MAHRPQLNRKPTADCTNTAHDGPPPSTARRGRRGIARPAPGGNASRNRDEAAPPPLSQAVTLRRPIRTPKASTGDRPRRRGEGEQQQVRLETKGSQRNQSWDAHLRRRRTPSGVRAVRREGRRRPRSGEQQGADAVGQRRLGHGHDQHGQQHPHPYVGVAESAGAAPASGVVHERRQRPIRPAATSSSPLRPSPAGRRLRAAGQHVVEIDSISTRNSPY